MRSCIYGDFEHIFKVALDATLLSYCRNWLRRTLDAGQAGSCHVLSCGYCVVAKRGNWKVEVDTWIGHCGLDKQGRGASGGASPPTQRNRACRTIIFDKLTHTTPIILAANQFESLAKALMTGGGVIVFFPKDAKAKVVGIRDIDATFEEEKT